MSTSWLVSCVRTWHLQQELSEEHSLSFRTYLLKLSQQFRRGALNLAASFPMRLSLRVGYLGFRGVAPDVISDLYIATGRRGWFAFLRLSFVPR